MSGVWTARLIKESKALSRFVGYSNSSIEKSDKPYYCSSLPLTSTSTSLSINASTTKEEVFASKSVGYSI